MIIMFNVRTAAFVAALGCLLFQYIYDISCCTLVKFKLVVSSLISLILMTCHHLTGVIAVNSTQGHAGAGDPGTGRRLRCSAR